MVNIMLLRIPNMVRYPVLIKSEYRLMSSSSFLHMGNNDNFVTKKMNELMIWYEQVTGMDEVRAAQNRVLEEERKLANAQERRLEANKLVSSVRSKLKDLHAALEGVTRGEERYLHLITKEIGLLKEERRFNDELQQYEREEREYFTALSSAVKDSHEKERAQAQRTKYWSIIGSVIGTVIGIAGSSLNNHFKLKKFQQLVMESIKDVRLDSGNIPQQLHKQEQQFNQIVAEMKAALSTNQSPSPLHVFSKSGNPSNEPTLKKIDNVIMLLNQHQAVMQHKFKDLEALITQSLHRAIKSNTQHSVPHLHEASLPNNAVELVIGGCAIIIVISIICCCFR